MAETEAMENLADLRMRIDAIDEQMHRLLIERGSVVDALVAAKGTDRNGVAFRPQREAEMMRRLVERHRGTLPLATVEHVWREIITTFTYLQAPFRVVVNYGPDPVAIHDLARFAFGFSVELVPAETAESAVATVAATGSDLAIIPLGGNSAGLPWWRGLAGTGPRIMALWPFIAGKGVTADAAAAIVSPELYDPAPSDLVVYAASDNRELGSNIPGGALIASAPGNSGREVLVAFASEHADAALTHAGLSNAVAVGGIARGLDLASGGDLLRTSVRP